MGICILKSESDALRKKLIAGEVRVEDLYAMSSEERLNTFKSFLKEGAAKQVNADFESKLILKNQQRGLQNWLNKQVDLPEPAKRDLLSRIQKMDQFLSESDSEKFLTDLAEKKLGASVTSEEANKLSELAQKVKDREGILTGNDSYGHARADFDQYLEDLKNPTNKQGLGDTAKAAAQDIKKSPFKIIQYAGGISKSIKAALDNSSLLRQGFKTLVTNPREWFTNAQKSFKYMYDTFGNKDVMREIRASMYNDPDFDLALRSKLAIGVDDAIPTTLQEKIPGIGKLFAASDNAFKGFLFKTRFDVFKKYVQIAKDAGLDIADKDFTEQIASMVNSQTGRGGLGRLEPIANTANNIFFSPRFIASQLDTFLHPITGAGGIKNITNFSAESNFVRKEATKSLAKTIAAIGGIMAIANAINPGSAETNPLSTDFGKIKVGNTRFDFTGGLGSLITVMARISVGKSKSPVSGKITELDSGKFGSKTTLGVGGDYIRNKLSPILGTAINLKTGSDSIGKPFGWKDVPANLLAPLPVTNFIESANDPKSAGLIATTIADFLGIATNTFGR